MAYKVEITIGNNTSEDVICMIPKGHVFENKVVGTRRQNVAAAREYRLVIPAGSSVTVDIEALCLNRTYARPSGPANVSIFKVSSAFSSQADLWAMMQNPIV